MNRPERNPAPRPVLGSSAEVRDRHHGRPIESSRGNHREDFAISKGFDRFLAASGPAPHQYIDSTFAAPKIIRISRSLRARSHTEPGRPPIKNHLLNGTAHGQGREMRIPSFAAPSELSGHQIRSAGREGDWAATGLVAQPRPRRIMSGETQ
jgi:hypothetical protein